MTFNEYFGLHIGDTGYGIFRRQMRHPDVFGIGATANAVGGVASAAITAYTALDSANAQRDAAKQIDQQAQQAAQTATQRVDTGVAGANTNLAGVLGQQQTGIQPYLDLGKLGASNLTAALQPGGSLNSTFSFDPSQIANNPDYQFNLNQGIQAVNRGAAATGTLKSGATLKALNQYASGLASTALNQYYNQALSTYQTNRNNALSSLTLPLQIGQNATQLNTGVLQNYGNQTSNNIVQGAVYGGNAGLQASQIGASALSGAANAQAAGIVGAGNAFSGLASNLGSLASLNRGGGGGSDAISSGGVDLGGGAVSYG